MYIVLRFKTSSHLLSEVVCWLCNSLHNASLLNHRPERSSLDLLGDFSFCGEEVMGVSDKSLFEIVTGNQDQSCNLIFIKMKSIYYSIYLCLLILFHICLAALIKLIQRHWWSFHTVSLHRKLNSHVKSSTASPH